VCVCLPPTLLSKIRRFAVCRKRSFPVSFCCGLCAFLKTDVYQSRHWRWSQSLSRIVRPWSVRHVLPLPIWRLVEIQEYICCSLGLRVLEVMRFYCFRIAAQVEPCQGDTCVPPAYLCTSSRVSCLEFLNLRSLSLV